MRRPDAWEVEYSLAAASIAAGGSSLLVGGSLALSLIGLLLGLGAAAAGRRTGA